MRHCLVKGEDIITFVDESLYISYARSTWWIDLGATVHVAIGIQCRENPSKRRKTD